MRRRPHMAARVVEVIDIKRCWSRRADSGRILIEKTESRPYKGLDKPRSSIASFDGPLHAAVNTGNICASGSPDGGVCRRIDEDLRYVVVAVNGARSGPKAVYRKRSGIGQSANNRRAVSGVKADAVRDRRGGRGEGSGKRIGASEEVDGVEPNMRAREIKAAGVEIQDFKFPHAVFSAAGAGDGETGPGEVRRICPVSAEDRCKCSACGVKRIIAGDQA